MLLRDGGLPAGAFIGEYLGELYAAWRWLERDNRTRECWGVRGAGSHWLAGTSIAFVAGCLCQNWH